MREASGALVRSPVERQARAHVPAFVPPGSGTVPAQPGDSTAIRRSVQRLVHAALSGRETRRGGGVG